MRPHCLGHIVTQAPPPPSPGHRIDFLAKAFYKSDLYIYLNKGCIFYLTLLCIYHPIANSS